jgi:hypothetical protein
MKSKLSEKQQQAMMYLEQSRAAGIKLSQHLRAQGVELRPMYDALAALRRKGVLASVSAKRKGSASPFVKVRVASGAPMTRQGVLCRVLIGGAAVMECGEWPPPAWVAALLGLRADAAP